jgi:hypothetical protein
MSRPREGVKARLYQVHKGMTLAEVEAVMGRPPDAIHESTNSGLVLSWDGWDGPYYRAEVVVNDRDGRVAMRRVFYLNHEKTLVDRWAPSCMDRMSPPAWLDGWWPQR